MRYVRNYPDPKHGSLGRAWGSLILAVLERALAWQRESILWLQPLMGCAVSAGCPGSRETAPEGLASRDISRVIGLLRRRVLSPWAGWAFRC